MSATSVTGKGDGSSEGFSQGTNRQTIQFDRIIGPHLIDFGKVNLESGADYSAVRVFFKTELPTTNGYYIMASIACNESVYSIIRSIDIAKGGICVHNFTETYVDFISGYSDEFYPPVVHWCLFTL
jgi:hypothetical protein